ncbi:MAG: hypothetical protein LAO23_20700 [Acidobacteriia bacterium]|nr:hypothetical protein [Terriglobia bacterium]
MRKILVRRILRKTTTQSTPFFVVAILCLIAFAALAAPQYPNQDRDRDRDRDRGFGRGFIRVSRESTAIDFGGGNGGRPSPDALCEEDSVAVGFHVQTGEYFNTAWLDCVRVRRDGDLGDEVRMTERTGRPGGRPVHDAFCPPGMVLRGLRGRTGASIDEAVGICSPFHEIAERRERIRTELTQSVLRPNAAGHPAGAECPRGSVITGLHSNSGEYMDHLWVLCSELRRGD